MTDDVEAVESRMVALAASHLADTGGALTADELVAALPDLGEMTADVLSVTVGQDGWTGDDLALEAAGYLEELLEHGDTGLGWVADGRWFDPAALCRDVVATVRVDEHVLTGRALRHGPDLAPLAALLDVPRAVASGGEAVPVVPALDDLEGEFLVELPDGALPRTATSGDLVALTWDGQALHLDVVDEPDAARTAEAVATLTASFVALVDEVGFEDPVVDVVDVVLAAQLDDGTFHEPQLPVSELVALAPLSLFGDHVGAADHDWDAWAADRGAHAAAWGLAMRHGLDAATGSMLSLAVEAVEREAAAGATARDDDPRARGHLRLVTDETTVGRGPVDEVQVGLLLEALQDPALAVALGIETAFEHPELADGLALLADRLRRHARGRDRAIAHHLLSVAAEGSGDVEEAARQATLAVRADPAHGPSALAASRYASLRGRAGEALRHLHGAFEPQPGNLMEDVLRTHAEPGPTDAPRNAPCPCGSGRKHKHCCASSNGWPVSTRAQWLLAKLREHVTGPHHEAEIEDVVEVMLEPVRHRVDQDAFDHLFANAFVHGMVLWEGGALASFLDLFAPLLPADELDLARRWEDAELELWEVVDTVPGEGVTLLGLSDGERVEVPDIAFSHSATVGGTVLARVLDADDHLELPALRPVELGDRGEVLALLDSEDRHDPLAWAVACRMRMPTLTNRDGDDFVMHTVTYRFGVDEETVVAALGTAFTGDVRDELVWLDPDDEDATVRGTLAWDDGALVATTNSARRRDELDAILAELFGDAIEVVDEDVADVDRLVAEGADGRGRTLDEMRPDELPEEVRDEVDALLAQHVRRAEERWVDEPVPALGGLTPREALDDPTRREDLLVLLDEFDDHAARTPAGRTFDVTRLRELLGLR